MTTTTTHISVLLLCCCCSYYYYYYQCYYSHHGIVDRVHVDEIAHADFTPVHWTLHTFQLSTFLLHLHTYTVVVVVVVAVAVSCSSSSRWTSRADVKNLLKLRLDICLVYIISHVLRCLARQRQEDKAYQFKIKCNWRWGWTVEIWGMGAFKTDLTFWVRLWNKHQLGSCDIELKPIIF